MPAPPLHFDLGGRALVFVEASPGRYTAELDGERRAIRVTTRKSDFSESGHTTDYGSSEELAETASLDLLCRCIELGAEPQLVGRVVRIAATDNWGHFRQSTSITVEISVSHDGPIDVAIHRADQNDSYY